MQLVFGSKPKTRIQLREMRVDFLHLCPPRQKGRARLDLHSPQGLPLGWIRHATRNQRFFSMLTVTVVVHSKSKLELFLYTKQEALPWFPSIEVA